MSRKIYDIYSYLLCSVSYRIFELVACFVEELCSVSVAAFSDLFFSPIVLLSDFSFSGSSGLSVVQSSTSLPRGNQVDGLPRACSLLLEG